VKPWGKHRILLLVGCYFLLHQLFRSLLSCGIGLDEAEQFLWAQDFRLGYWGELPLYTWLQACLSAVFGTNLFAASLLKNLLLFVTYLFTYLVGWEVTRDRRCAAAAMLTLFFIPQIAWESQRVLTHMALATALASMALYFFLRMVRAGELSDYLCFGCAAGLGMLSKYNFGIFLLALLLSACSLRPFRACLADRKMAAALAVFLVVVSVPFSWIALHPDLAMAKSHKLYAPGGPGQLPASLAGFLSLLKSAAAFASPPFLLYGVLFFRAPRVFPPDRSGRDCARLIARMMLFTLMICLLLVVCGVTQFRVRWMQPLLIPLPVFLCLLVRERLDDRRFRRIRQIAAGVALLLLLLMNGRILFPGHFKSLTENEPYQKLAEEIVGRGFSNGVIVAEDRYLGGNLKPFFRSSRILVPEAPPAESLQSPLPKPLLVVWKERGKKEMPGELYGFLYKRLGRIPTPMMPSFAEAPYCWGCGRTMRLGFVILNQAGPGLEQDS
jgi:hypothetical protein